MAATQFRIEESLEELEQLFRQEQDVRRSRRLHFLVLVKGELVHRIQEAAKYLRVHRNTVSRWKQSYIEGGLELLLTVKESGRRRGQRTLPDEVFMALRQHLETTGGVSSYKELQDWLEEVHGVVINYKTLYRIVRNELEEPRS